jgi:large subunit ribosomal protein L4
MTKIKIYNMEGKVVGEKELAPKLFNVKIDEGLVHFVSGAQADNARTASAHTKTRGEVRGGGKKPWKQKGTGRARQGSTRSPIWVGGGITFGPRPNRNFSKKVNKKTKLAVLAMALTDKAQNDGLVAIEALTVADGKTKKMAALMAKLPVKRNILVVLPKSDEMVIRSSRNLQKVHIVNVSDVSLLDLLKADSVVAPVATIEAWEAKFRK